VDKFIHPVGPEPASVYWRRRAAVLVGLVAVIVILIMIIKALAGGGKPESSASPSLKSPAPSASTSQTADAVPACTGQQFTGGALAQGADILLTKDKPAYGPGEPVTLKAQVKNTSDQDCELLNNAHNVVLNVVSGTDRIFDSSDCAAQQPEDSGQAILIKAGATAEIPISWDATRSQQGCPETVETPFRAKDATYVAVATIAGVASDQTQFLLTP
jgi:hypothetical protein